MRAAMRSYDASRPKSAVISKDYLASSSEYGGISLVLCSFLRSQNPGGTEIYSSLAMCLYIINVAMLHCPLVSVFVLPV